MSRAAAAALWWSPAAAIMAAIAWFSHRPAWPQLVVGLPDWLLHMIAYGLLALACAVGSSRGLARRSRSVLVRAWLVAFAYGGLDELHQSTVPGRDAAAADWLADGIGALLALLALAVLGVFGGPSGRVGQSSVDVPPPTGRRAGR